MKSKNYISSVWCGLFLTAVIGFPLERAYLVEKLTSEEHLRFLVIDETCFFLPKSLSFEEAQDLHFDQAQLACETLLNRSPGGIDNSKRLEHLFKP